MLEVSEEIAELGLNWERGNLMVMTEAALYRSILSSPPNLMEPSAVFELKDGGEKMRVQGAWTYIQGERTALYHDDGIDGLSYKWALDLEDWVYGRLLDEGQAEYVNRDGNMFEVWRD